MSDWIKQLRRKLPKWLGGTRLSEQDQAQAQLMGMALASLKAAETNALLTLQLTRQLKDVKVAVAKLQEPTGVIALYTLAANQAKDFLEQQPEGSSEQEATLLMSSELFGIAKTLKDRLEGAKPNEN